MIGALRTGKDGQAALVNRIYGEGSISGSSLNTEDNNRPLTIDEWDEIMTQQVDGSSSGILANDRAKFISEKMSTQRPANYADEIPPFDITISFANEYGQRAHLTIFAAEILNEGTGFSIDSVTTEKACTFVARRVGYLEAGEEDQATEANINPNLTDRKVTV